MTAWTGTSSSKTREKTGKFVYRVAYPSIRKPLYTGIATKKKQTEKMAWITDIMRPL